ncbi:hypothetical protein ACWELJ_06105 [Nocardia sp. NPDC004582]
MTGDKTQIANLKSPAQSGTLKFDDSAVADMVNACNGLLGKFIGLQSFTDRLTGLKAFAGPPEKFFSGTRLADEYSSKGGDLADAIKEHIAILDDLVFTYKAAGKSYAGAETESVQNFENIQRPVGASFSSAPPDPAKVKAPGFTSKDPANVQATGVHAISAETPTSKQWIDLYDLRMSIDSASVAYVGELWKWIAGQINDALPDFTNKIQSTNSKWDGYGADTARSSTSSYADSVGKFSVALKAVGDQIVYISGWLEEAKKNMPPSANNPAGQIISWPTGMNLQAGVQMSTTMFTDDTPKYQENYRKTYVAGIADYNGAMLSIPSPNTPVTPPTVQQPGSPSSTDQNGGGNPSSPGSPTVPSQPNIDNKQPETPNKDQPTKTPTTDDTLKTIAQELATTAQTVAQQLTSAVSTGVQGLESIAQQVATTVQQQLSTTQTPKQPDDQKETPNPLTNLSSLLTPTGSTSGPGGPVGTSTAPKSPESPKSQLSQRTTVANAQQEESVTATTRAGVAATATSSSGASSGMPGMGSMGHGGGATGQAKEHKRPTFLTSAEHFDEVVGEVPDAVTPVAEK